MHLFRENSCDDDNFYDIEDYYGSSNDNRYINRNFKDHHYQDDDQNYNDDDHEDEDEDRQAADDISFIQSDSKTDQVLCSQVVATLSDLGHYNRRTKVYQLNLKECGSCLRDLIRFLRNDEICFLVRRQMG